MFFADINVFCNFTDKFEGKKLYFLLDDGVKFYFFLIIEPWKGE